MTMVNSPSADRAADLTPVLVLGGLLIMLGINLILWPVDYAPLIDLPNHFARHALQCAEDPEAGLGRYFTYDFVLVPNLTAELVHILPMACGALFTTQKLLIQFSTSGLLVATLVLHASIWRRWSVWPLVATFGTHHMSFAYGFENYALALVPTLLVLSVWFLLCERRSLLRLVILAPLAALVYVFHLYAFTFLFGTILLLEFQRWWQGAGQAAGTALGLGLVAALPVAHVIMVAWSTNGVDPGVTQFGPLIARITTILSPFTPLGFPLLDDGTLRVAALQLVLFALVLLACRRAGGIASKPGTALALYVMLGVTLIFPTRLGGVYQTDIRFPVLMLCLFVACTDVRLPRSGAAALVVALCMLTAFRAVWLESRWSIHDAEVRELLTLVPHLAPEDRVLVASDGAWGGLRLHVNSPSHLAREVGFFLPDIFTGGNALSARPEVAHRDAPITFPVPVSELVREADGAEVNADPFRDGYWADWTEFYTHVLVLTGEGAENPAPAVLGQEVDRGSFFVLYRRSVPGN